MTNEEFQNLVLAELKALKEDISNLKEGQQYFKEDLSNLKGDTSGLKEQLDENTQIIKAIRHNQELTNAKLEGLELTTAKAESIEELRKDVNCMQDDLTFLIKKTADNSADIRKLKAVK